jgi:hypothetical protein
MMEILFNNEEVAQIVEAHIRANASFLTEGKTVEVVVDKYGYKLVKVTIEEKETA